MPRPVRQDAKRPSLTAMLLPRPLARATASTCVALVPAALAALALSPALPHSGLSVAQAQAAVTPTREWPVSFDDAARIVAITPPLAQRLRLVAPAWPVAGDFREARLYATDAGHVLVVARADGSLERYALDAAAVSALRAAVAERYATRRSPSAEPGSDVVSEPAGFAFARNQLVVGALVYGPAMAALAGESGDGSAAAGAYLLSAGAPFFVALSRSRRGEPITRAQNHLATDAGPRMAIVASGAFYAISGNRDTEPYQGTVLAGAIAGTIAGLRVGRGLTDGEAAAMTAGSTMLTAVTAGAMGIAGRFDANCRTRTDTYGTDPVTGVPYTYTYSDCDGPLDRADYGVLAAAALAGYPLGLQWVRRASYGITAGDVRGTFTSGLVGAMAATTVLSDDGDGRVNAGIMTAGLVGGVLLGDRLIAKRYDYTRGQGTLLGVGAIGGGLMGLALPTLGSADDGRVYLGAAAAGAIGGMIFTHGLLDPAPAGTGSFSREVNLRFVPAGATPAGHGAMRFELDPTAAALALGRTPGRHSLLRLTF